MFRLRRKNITRSALAPGLCPPNSNACLGMLSVAVAPSYELGSPRRNSPPLGRKRFRASRCTRLPTHKCGRPPFKVSELRGFRISGARDVLPIDIRCNCPAFCSALFVKRMIIETWLMNSVLFLNHPSRTAIDRMPYVSCFFFVVASSDN